MTNDYSSFTNAELSKQIEKMQAELQKRERIEEERRGGQKFVIFFIIGLKTMGT